MLEMLETNNARMLISSLNLGAALVCVTMAIAEVLSCLLYKQGSLLFFCCAISGAVINGVFGVLLRNHTKNKITNEITKRLPHD